MKTSHYAAIAASIISTTSALRLEHRAVPLSRRQQPVPAAKKAVCTDQKCLDYSKYILESMAPNHTAIDPCVDFDKFACDGFRTKRQYRPDQAALSVSSVMSDTIRDMLHALLEGEYAENSTFTGADRTYDKANFQKMKTVYNTCMNQDKIKAYGIQPVKDILKEFEALYPAKGPAVQAKQLNSDLTDTVSWLYKWNVAGLISAGVSADDMNPDTQIISMGQSELQLSKQYYTKPAVLANYTRAVADMLYVIASGKTILEEPLPADKNATFYEKAARIVGFEKAIAEKTADPEVQSKIEYYYNLQNISSVQSLVPELSIERYLTTLRPEGYSISPQRSVIVGDSNYYKNLSSLISGTSRETLHDYFEWRLIITWAGRLHRDYTIPTRRFSNIMAGRDPDVLPERWRTCVSEVDGALGHLLGGAFISRAFTKKDKQLGDQIIIDIKKVFEDQIKGLDWMSPSAKEVAAQKVVNLVQKIGYQTKNPNEESPEELLNYYSNLTISDNYFNNAIQYNVFGQNKTWSDLLKPTDKDRWEMTSPTVNAYFMPPLNFIVFPAGIMQPPNFSGDLPEYVSYGAFGATAGHEITHAFDDNGSKYDASGRYREWWDNSTIKNFDGKAQCFVKQYAQFTVEGLEGERVPVNGQLTLGENIADSGGLNAAFVAWKKRESAAPQPNPGLPGLEKFSNDQLFFLSFANSWCEKVRKEALLSQIYSDPHAPADTRAIGSVANSADFRKAFNCKVKEPTCLLW